MLLFIFSLLTSFQTEAMVSACISYDTENTHPDDLRVPQFIKCMRKGSSLWVDGGIDPFLLYELHTFNEEPIKTIYLNSGGGRVEDAFEIARFIRDNQITTIVRKNALCASACTMLFQAGTRRIAHRGARFMYHSARYLMINSIDQAEIADCVKKPVESCQEDIVSKKQSLVATTHEMFDLYEEFGASPQLREDYFSMPVEAHWWESGNFVGLMDWWIMAKDLVHYNVVTELISD